MANERCVLTGLPTGKAFDDVLDTLVSQSREDGWALFIRLDRIEYINLTYGRDEGDETLKSVAETIGHATDVALYRHDGPILVAILHGDTGYVFETAERIRKEIANSSELVEPVSVSIAVISADEGDDRVSVENIAFSRLLNAQRRGGNVVVAVSHVEDDGEGTLGFVLIVDPDVDTLGILIREIESLGLGVLTATDGMEALQLVSQYAPDVIITEINVPKLSGLELRTKMRSISSFGEIPFILISHRQTDELIREAASLGILHYHRKPVRAVLIAELVRILAASRFQKVPGS